MLSRLRRMAGFESQNFDPVVSLSETQSLKERQRLPLQAQAVDPAGKRCGARVSDTPHRG